MGLSSAFKELLKDSDKLNPEVKHGSLTSTRLWVLVGFVAMCIWFRLPIETIARYAFLLGMTYMGANTITKLATIVVNGWIRRSVVVLAAKDGVLDEREALLIEQQGRQETTAGVTDDKR